MDTELVILKAQFEALRNYFTSLLPTIFSHDKEQSDKIWLAKFCLWRFDRENLVPCSSLSCPVSPETNRIDHRRFQLQILMDVAYIQGHLEEYGIARQISPESARLANWVFEHSDGSEQTMIDWIEKF